MNRTLLKNTLFVCIILILVLVVLYSGLRILESTVLFQEEVTMQTTSKTIRRDGVKYYPRQDITVVLLMGINQEGKVTPTPFNIGGASDMITLMIFDEQTRKCDLLALNRDMMVDIPMLDMTGEPGLPPGNTDALGALWLLRWLPNTPVAAAAQAIVAATILSGIIRQTADFCG